MSLAEAAAVAFTSLVFTLAGLASFVAAELLFFFFFLFAAATTNTSVMNHAVLLSVYTALLSRTIHHDYTAIRAVELTR